MINEIVVIVLGLLLLSCIAGLAYMHRSTTRLYETEMTAFQNVCTKLTTEVRETLLATQTHSEMQYQDLLDRILPIRATNNDVAPRSLEELTEENKPRNKDKIVDSAAVDDSFLS